MQKLVRRFLNFDDLEADDLEASVYSYVSNKRAVGNRRAGWIFSGILIIVQGGYDSSDE